MVVAVTAKTVTSHYVHENASVQQFPKSGTKGVSEKSEEQKKEIPLEAPWYVPLPRGFRPPPGLPHPLDVISVLTSYERVPLTCCESYMQSF